MATLSSASGRIWLSTSNPGLSEENCEKGNFWLNTSILNLYICTDPTIGAQVWTLIIGT